MNVAELLRALATLSWLAALAVIAIAVLRAARGAAGLKGTGSMVAVAIALAVVLTTVSAGLVFVQPEDRGVVISAVAPGGYRTEPLEPGLHWVIPFAENVVMYPISRQTYTMSIAPSEGAIQGDDSVTARTADGQEVFIDASVIFAIDPAEVVNVHIRWQGRYIDELVRPVARGIIRDAASQFGVEELVSSQRDAFKAGIDADMSAQMTDNGIELIDFVLRNITFSDEYAASVEQKQIAEQLAQQAAFVVEQRKQEAEQARQTAQGLADAAVIAAKGDAQARVIQAEAEAQALKLIAEALANNPDLITYQYVQKLAPGIQVMLVPNDNPFLLPLPTLTPGANP
ncbi:MAG TPA: SPFH domain-containing protein [Anaerolineales bacterium]|nr:SPFH domain-containing protein [Anaerolineales bacterium]